jgi:hypothetical protein
VLVMSEKTVGGFIGDPAEAFDPPSSSGCCGMAPTAEVKQATSCCGSPETVAEPKVIAVPVVEAEPAAGKSGCCG